MKKIYILGILLLLAINVPGQVPASFKYQALLRDARGNARANTSTNITIEILQGSATGIVVYSENHNVTTDGYGIINLDLGNGAATVGSMSGINWNTGSFYVKITVDGSVMGTSQLLSVPYALYSAKAANGFSGDYNDLINRPTLGTGTVTSVTGTSPVNVLTGTTTPVISMTQASASTNGYLSSTDWTTFNNKSSYTGTWSDITGKPAFATVATSGNYNDLINKPTLSATVTSVTGVAPVYVLTGTTTPVIFVSQSSALQSGYLSSADWITFNNKSTFDGTWSALTGKPVIDGSETIINAGTNIALTGTGTAANPYVVNNKAHDVGEEYGGGIVFFVYDGGLHGLIAAKEDLLGGQYDDNPYFQWFYLYCPEGCYTLESGAKGDGLLAGAMNTTLIVASQVSYNVNHWLGFPMQDFAAKSCSEYESTDGTNIFGDWYLPSKYELNLLYLSMEKIAALNLSPEDYWSSSEIDENNAWYQSFFDGTQNFYTKDGPYFRVRAIRAF